MKILVNNSNLIIIYTFTDITHSRTGRKHVQEPFEEVLAELCVDVGFHLQDGVFARGCYLEHCEYLAFQVVRTVSHDVRLRVYPLDKGAMLLIKGKQLFDGRQVADSREVHVELGGHVVFREAPELQVLLRGDHEGLAEEYQVHRQLELGASLILSIGEVHIGLLHHLGTYVDCNLDLLIGIN